jgi:predicted metal-binding membrane protein
MAEMGRPPLSTGYLFPTFAMWAVMMVAMMVPSVAPMILLHARIDKADTTSERALHSLMVAFGYLLVWVGFSAAAALAQALLVHAGAVSGMSIVLEQRHAAVALLIVAAAYELTAAKRLCLEKCQAPMLFILNHWKPGNAGALRLGLTHGLYCVGCCWALMLLLFVGGVMNLAWVALLGIVVLAQKYAPSSWHAERCIAALLALVASMIALAMQQLF